MFKWQTSSSLTAWLSSITGSTEKASEEQRRKAWSMWLGDATEKAVSEERTLQGRQISRFLEGSDIKHLGMLAAGPATLLTVSKMESYLSGNAIPIISTVFAILPSSTSPLGHVAQLGSSILMMLSIKGLGSHETSKKGNLLGITGVSGAILTVILTNWTSSAAGLTPQFFWFLPVAILGQYIGVSVAKAVEMENLPELVAGFHSLTGLAAVLVGIASQMGAGPQQLSSVGRLIETFLGVSVGAATFSGSVAAAAKLHGMIPGGPIGLDSRFAVNTASLVCVGVTFGSFLFLGSPSWKIAALLGNTLASLALGTMLVLPVGGSDIPIVISFLNAMSGLATSATGFSMNNSLLVMTGALVASSGAILSDIMCKGINRSLISVLMGGFGVDTSSPLSSGTNISAAPAEVTTLTVQQLVTKLQGAKKVLIIPGYGMAVARCQSGVSEIYSELSERGIEVVFGIHPVAGRLPGHMNVILSEADIPYDCVKEMDHVNRDMHSFDVAIVLGANDIVNPATASDSSSPIYGMPAIECWRAKEVIVMKRSLNTGYSGVDNPLFYLGNTSMLFGDAKQSVDLIHSAIRDSDKSEWPHSLEMSEKNSRSLDAGKEIFQEEEILAKIDFASLPAYKVIGGLKSCDVAKEKRIAISPKVCLKLRKLGFSVVINSGFGDDCGWSDSVFEKFGATVLPTETAVLQRSDIVLKVTPLTDEQMAVARPPEEVERKQIVITSFAMNGTDDQDPILKRIISSSHPVTTFNLNLVPRISRAQAMDVLSSMANIGGYKATINAFFRIGKLSRPSVTAGGTIPGAKVFVIGCGVAGLSAIATAHALGATVYATDVRSVCKEQVESIGAFFVEVPSVEEEESVSEQGGYAGEVSSSFAERQKHLYKNFTAIADVVITTAMVPGKKSPVLLSSEMVRSMKPGSIIVDMAAGSGGNCELTVADQIISDETSKVIIDGTTNYASELAQLSSELFSQNCFAFLENLCSKQSNASSLNINTEDVIVRQSLIVLDGACMYPPPPLPPSVPSLSVAPKSVILPLSQSSNHSENQHVSSSRSQDVLLICGAAALGAIGISGDHRTVRLVGDFALSSIIGYFTVSSVTPALHTPLISVTNAVSGIIVVGGMLEIDSSLTAKSALALSAVLASLINVSGGFAVTDRMLAMFKRASK